MSSTSNKVRILLTGPPGIGKTTIIKKVCSNLKDQRKFTGFYTQELKERGQRKGFDIVTIEGKSSILARKSELISFGMKSHAPTVGQYAVDVNSFESHAIPSISVITYDAKNKSYKVAEDKSNNIVVIDEIGKMELFSRKFSATVQCLFEQSDVSILATIPCLDRGKPPQFVKELCQRNDIKVVTVDRKNRDELVSEVEEMLMSAT